MARFREETLSNWASPPSNSEEAKLASAERMVNDALRSAVNLNRIRFEVFGQGSYANDTNVRNNSDVDINVRLLSTVHVEVPTGKEMQDYNYTPSAYTFNEYRQEIHNALGQYFGYGEIESRNKCLKVIGNSYRIQADVVPTFGLHQYYENGGSRKEGSWFVSLDGQVHTNYAKEHIENGKRKNARTAKRFKRLCRIMKRVRYQMENDGLTINPGITSFLIESLLYNVPDHIFNDHSTWTERLRQAILYLYNETLDAQKVKDWGEVSECLYLFHITRRWTVQEVNAFMLGMWTYLQFS